LKTPSTNILVTEYKFVSILFFTVRKTEGKDRGLFLKPGSGSLVVEKPGGIMESFSSA